MEIKFYSLPLMFAEEKTPIYVYVFPPFKNVTIRNKVGCKKISALLNPEDLSLYQ